MLAHRQVACAARPSSGRPARGPSGGSARAAASFCRRWSSRGTGRAARGAGGRSRRSARPTWSRRRRRSPDSIWPRRILLAQRDDGLEAGRAGHAGRRTRGSAGDERRAEHGLAGEVEVLAVLEHGARGDLADALALQAEPGDEAVERRGEHVLVAGPRRTGRRRGRTGSGCRRATYARRADRGGRPGGRGWCGQWRVPLASSSSAGPSPLAVCRAARRARRGSARDRCPKLTVPDTFGLVSHVTPGPSKPTALTLPPSEAGRARPTRPTPPAADAQRAPGDAADGRSDPLGRPPRGPPRRAGPRGAQDASTSAAPTSRWRRSRPPRARRSRSSTATSPTRPACSSPSPRPSCCRSRTRSTGVCTSRRPPATACARWSRCTSR